ncbi:dATP/dGTP pyrophosphohydrolase domain-containing protein [Pseudophaeobacter sp. EL27]|uniref:dATP/dGTP pyrophosphohydrolase domain-containing protein n=1 Tax=Pseudophaeobacter sp. EL27 TaxID=2107580 RepID=UPI000EFCB0A7|nr:dATP/dGTP pyrophosphohydrolase domain-containing protein [Pseudophaeobacter sp. EL27]
MTNAASPFALGLTQDQVNRMTAIATNRREWSRKTFGDVGPVGPLEHLAEEAVEAKNAPTNPEEYADCTFLIWDALERQNSFTVDQFIDAIVRGHLILQ